MLGNCNLKEEEITVSKLDQNQLSQINAYWRAANYLTIGQIFLQENRDNENNRAALFLMLLCIHKIILSLIQTIVLFDRASFMLLRYCNGVIPIYCLNILVK